jgi:SAM-dependent methyltransferase
MTDMLKRIVRAGVRQGLRQTRVRRLVEAQLSSLRVPLMVENATGQFFVDRYGVGHALDPSLRDRLKPGWRTMLDPSQAVRVPPVEELRSRAKQAADIVKETDQVVAAVTGTALTGRILEIGCYDGAVAFQLALREGTDVVASDLVRYYVVQQPGRPNHGDGDLQSQQAVSMLGAARKRAGLVAGVPSDRVRFVEDDISASSLEPESFDAIVSFEVLEHVASPRAAFASMARLLAPGGVAYHDYNPFFSVIGGHSLCTLDMAWGHARLEPVDFERYLVEVRPAEADQALRFYRESLNRLALADLRLAVAQAELELVALLPWSDRALVPDLTPQIVSEVQRAYPAAAAEDLLATFVSVVVRKP